MSRPWIALCLLASLFSGANGMAAQGTLGAGGPPLSYRIADVAVRIHIQGSRGMPVRQVTLDGKGSGTLVRDKLTQSFAYPPQDLLAVVNVLYRSRFFTLHDGTGVAHSVVLRDDGMVVTQALKMNDVGSTRVCFSVASYEKCVGFLGDMPPELKDLVQNMLTQSERLAGLPAK